MQYEVFECFEKHVNFDAITPGGFILKDNRYHCLYGGRGSGKSVFAAKTLSLEGYLSPLQIMCCREFQNSIADSSMALIWEQIEDLGLDSFYTKTKTEIIGENGSRFFFRGLKTNITSIKSIARIDRVFCDEAEAIPDESWSVLTPSIRTEGARFIICFNPRSISDSTYQRFVVNPPTDAIVTKANFPDNPYFPEALRQEMSDMKLKDPDNFLHVWMGEPLATSALSIIPNKWARACIDIHKLIGIEIDGFKQMGFDVSSSGPDENCVATIHGQVVTRITEFKQGDPTSAAYDAFELALQDDVNSIFYDSIGVGAGVGQTLSGPNFKNTTSKGLGDDAIKIDGFNAGGAILQPSVISPGNTKSNGETYLNAKSQTWGNMRYRIQQGWLAKNGMDYDRDAVISFSSDHINNNTIEKMIFELSTPEREYVGSKLKVESKEKLLRRGVKSHNIADALLMACYTNQQSSLSSVLAARKARRGR